LIMSVGLLGRKIGMTQVWGADGHAVPVTVLEVGPCHVLQLRTKDKDGYEAVQLGFADKLSRADLARDQAARSRGRASRAERGQVTNLSGKNAKKREAQGVEVSKKAECEPQRFIREFRTDGEQHGCEIGQVLTANALEGVAKVDVIGTSKGRGFSGVMRRHNFKGQRASHGVKKCHRKPGGIGQATDPSRVWKGKRMAGRFGGDRRTVRNLAVIRIDAENHMLLVNGPVPGPNGGYVVIRKA
jgi:large subunit ribosomal protein L3